ncbi:MAG: MBL fold metallo-hydrolase [Gammaproteobacteria bacterium]|nr:MBL fold metallo-hydrolase [Gammaproteobacteria bacterium]
MKRTQYIFRIMVCFYLLQPLLIHAETSYPVITILNEGYVMPIEGRNFVPGERNDGARLVASTVAMIQAGSITIIVDPGMVSEDVDLVKKIESVGVEIESITHVFISHHHPDHTVRIGMFPNASVVDFWGSYKNDFWEDHGDRYEIAKNVMVIRTPGHTDEDASLVVVAENGTYVFTHVWWNEKMEPVIDPLAEDADNLIESRKMITEIADFIIPGHGKMFKNPLK